MFQSSGYHRNMSIGPVRIDSIWLLNVFDSIQESVIADML